MTYPQLVELEEIANRVREDISARGEVFTLRECREAVIKAAKQHFPVQPTKEELNPILRRIDRQRTRQHDSINRKLATLRKSQRALEVLLAPFNHDEREEKPKRKRGK